MPVESHAGVVEEQVDRAESFQGAVHHAAPRLCESQIARGNQGASAAGARQPFGGTRGER